MIFTMFSFGVGFYSLWSVCGETSSIQTRLYSFSIDDPFVESGDRWMGFYWKDGKDQLLARTGDLPPSASTSIAGSSSTGHPWTSFTMSLREPTVLEGPLDLARFLITSLTFMRTMKKIDMLVDDIRVLEVEKSIKGKERVGKKGMKTTSSAGMMTVMGVDVTGMSITAKVMKWLSGKPTARIHIDTPQLRALHQPLYQYPSLQIPSQPRGSHRSSLHRFSPAPLPRPLLLPPLHPLLRQRIRQS